jgi:four helix bundle protein
MQESPIFTKTFDMLEWLLPATLKFPREHRFVLAKRAQNAAFNFYEAIIAASLNKETMPHLQQADIELQRLRLYIRLCQRLQFFSAGQYQHISAMLEEIGKLLGGWMRKRSAV